MNGDNLLHFYYHFCSSVGIAKIPQDVVSCIGQSYWQLWYVAPLHGTRRTVSQKSLVFSENRAGDSLVYWLGKLDFES